MNPPVTTSPPISQQDVLNGVCGELPLWKPRPVSRRAFLALGATASALGLLPACRITRTGRTTSLTPEAPGVWDFRASVSDDGTSIVFCRAETGGAPGLWMMDAGGRHARLLTRGIDDKGADHPRWLPGGCSPTLPKDQR